MYLKLLIEINKPFLIPWNYRDALTGIIYETLAIEDENFSRWLHDVGYKRGNKSYRLFVYSDLKPWRFTIDEKGMNAIGHLTWTIASPDENFINKFLSGLRGIDNTILLFQNKLTIIDLVCLEIPQLTNNIVCKTLSPVVISTWDGKSKHQTYRNPQEPEFCNSIEKNLIYKWESFYNEKWIGEKFSIRIWNPTSKLVPVFNINVRGWHLNV